MRDHGTEALGLQLITDKALLTRNAGLSCWFHERILGWLYIHLRAMRTRKVSVVANNLTYSAPIMWHTLRYAGVGFLFGEVPRCNMVDHASQHTRRDERDYCSQALPLTLRWRCLDEDKQCWTSRRRFYKGNVRPFDKTKGSLTKVPVADTLVAELVEWREQLTREGNDTSTEAVMFPGRFGGPRLQVTNETGSCANSLGSSDCRS